MYDQPRALTEIIEDQASFYKNPANPDISPPAMSQIAVQCLGTCGTKENSPEHPETAGVVGQKFVSINRAE